jgi:hypothetical protein
MGPLFSMAVMAIAASVAFSAVALVFRFFLPTRVALVCALGFLIGAGMGAALAVGTLALTMRLTILRTTEEVVAYFAILTICSVLGAAAVSWQCVRRLRP